MGRRIIGLTGYAQVGKDTVGAVLREEGYERRAFADKMKAQLLLINPWVPDGDHSLVRLVELVGRIGWDRAKAENAEVRRLMQNVGAREVLGQDVWVKALMPELDPNRAYVITDVRFPNEADAIKMKGGQVWRVVRPGVGPLNDSITETAMDGYTDIDYTVVNDGDIAELAQRVEWGLTRPPGAAIDAVRRADDAHFIGGPARWDVV